MKHFKAFATLRTPVGTYIVTNEFEDRCKDMARIRFITQINMIAREPYEISNVVIVQKRRADQ